jgi:aflatoxin B1 aldehyde reductase
MLKQNLVLGTITFGQQVFYDEAKKMINTFLNKGYHEIDTAYVYNEGECERVLGKVFASIDRDKYSIAAKVNPRISGKLDGEAVRQQLPESLDRMGIESADIVYLHFPDPFTPVESALETLNEFHRQGKFNELGLSNFPAWMVADVYHKCKQNGWVLPTVFQGVYNPLSRKAETELFAALRSYGIRFYSYNPLAGGMLTGKHTSFEEGPTDGRFTLRSSYPKRYWKKSFFDAVDILRQSLGSMSMVEATYRWMAFHSMLDMEKGDAIIIGASNQKQLEQNLTLLDNGPLTEEIVSAFDAAWSVSKADSPEYFTLFKGK